MPRLDLLQRCEELLGLQCVAAIPFQIRNQMQLPLDIPMAFGRVRFGRDQTGMQSRAIRHRPIPEAASGPSAYASTRRVFAAW